MPHEKHVYKNALKMAYGAYNWCVLLAGKHGLGSVGGQVWAVASCDVLI